MNAVEIIAQAALETGYRREAVQRDYVFADVLNPQATIRKIALAAFTQTPASYRSAAFGVITNDAREPRVVVDEHRALGAPILFVITGDIVGVWQVRISTPPRFVERLSVAELPQLFERHRESWQPEAISRAKSIGAGDSTYQLDFVDAGLLPAIEGEVHAKLDRLLSETLDDAHQASSRRQLDQRVLFRVVFRLLAAKVLQDRGHPFAEDWDQHDLRSVFEAIERYYTLPTVPLDADHAMHPAFEAAWSRLRDGISFSNISSDDLAFVYENTLVTTEIREHFGTHSTPHQLAEYIVRHLELWRHDPAKLHVYEPFAGAGVFLVSALRHLKAQLPVDWTDRQRHDFLVNHLKGDELEAFACEVAPLSLILADYPNHNGWRIDQTDLFVNNALAERMRAHNVILCNPPFEKFTEKERAHYKLSANTYSKPMMVLNAALDAHPIALGFVLPRPFILERQYAELRGRIERLYGSIELVELPDRTFGASKIEAAALIARDPRPPAPNTVALISTEIADRDRVRFLKTGEVTIQRSETRPVSDQPSGELWISSLAELWTHLSSYPRLDSKLRPRWGLQWTYDQSQAWADEPKSGFLPGIHSARRLKQFDPPQAVWIDYRRKFVRRGFDQDWSSPKIVINAARLSRGPWRIGAFLDTRGLLYSQQFFGLRPTSPTTEAEFFALSAVLNGPVANAFLAVHSPAKGLRIAAVSTIPIPPSLPKRLADLVAEYIGMLTSAFPLQAETGRVDELVTLIDAAVLEAYDLPPRLERQLLDYFRAADRPVAHTWTHWDESYPMPGLRLAERLSGRFRPKGNWIAEVFRPLPEREAALLRKFGE